MTKRMQASIATGDMGGVKELYENIDYDGLGEVVIGVQADAIKLV